MQTPNNNSKYKDSTVFGGKVPWNVPKTFCPTGGTTACPPVGGTICWRIDLLKFLKNGGKSRLMVHICGPPKELIIGAKRQYCAHSAQAFKFIAHKHFFFYNILLLLIINSEK